MNDRFRGVMRLARSLHFASAVMIAFTRPNSVGSMSKRLLILMEDETVTTQALALDLTEAGYRVETALDGEEAARKIGRGRFDLLIVPERSAGGSAQVVEAFRRRRPTAKVVLMTTDGGKKKGVEKTESGVRVRKPFDLEDFRSLVNELLEADSTGGSAM